jgi:hypothetical protein
MGDITRASRQHPENESPEPVPNGSPASGTGPSSGGSRSGGIGAVPNSNRAEMGRSSGEAGTSNTQGTSNGGSQ